MALGLQLLRCNHPATHLPDEKTGRGLGTKQAAGSAALASDPQPRGRRHLPPCPHPPLSSAGVGRVPGRRPFLRLRAPQIQFPSGSGVGGGGEGWPPQGLFQAEAALPGNKGRCSLRGAPVLVRAEAREPRVRPPPLTHPTRGHQGASGTGRLPVSVGVTRGPWAGAGRGRRAGPGADLTEVHRIGGWGERKGSHPTKGSEKEAVRLDLELDGHRGFRGKEVGWAAPWLKGMAKTGAGEEARVSGWEWLCGPPCLCLGNSGAREEGRAEGPGLFQMRLGRSAGSLKVRTSV